MATLRRGRQLNKVRRVAGPPHTKAAGAAYARRTPVGQPGHGRKRGYGGGGSSTDLGGDLGQRLANLATSGKIGREE
jgi:hypothetical protein